MGNIKQEWANAASTLLHEAQDIWKSPRGVVIRIEALAVMAMVLSFLLGVFGSCRRWSNRWIIQKGFLVAYVLSLSLGTYSIGLMQSSSVKSDMYPVWGVSLLTLFGCVDPITEYNANYKSQVWKIVYQICLLSGYVLLICITTTSSRVDNKAIGVLSAITFMKVVHRSLAFVLQSFMPRYARLINRHMDDLVSGNINVDQRSHPDQDINDTLEVGVDRIRQEEYDPRDLTGYRYIVSWYRLKFFSRPPTGSVRTLKDLYGITIDMIWRCTSAQIAACKDVCLSLSLSRLLLRRFFGITCAESGNPQMAHDLVFKGLLHKGEGGILDYERAFKVIEVELAFLYDTFFTSNPYHCLSQPEATSIWALTSLIGIYFVGVATLNPGTRSTIGHNFGDTTVLETTKTDFAITLAILASLALLQVLQLMRCWVSNLAAVSFACDYIRRGIICHMMPWMILRSLLARINCFHNYYWQNKIGQVSFVESLKMREYKLIRRVFRYRVAAKFGLPFMYKLVMELLGKETGYTIALKAHVKVAIVEFLHENDGHTRTDNPSLSDRIGSSDTPRSIRDRELDALEWHIATCYCELAQRKKGFFCFGMGKKGFENKEDRKNHDVATALSKYYAYLMVSAPELLGKAEYYYRKLARQVKSALRWKCDKLKAMKMLEIPEEPDQINGFQAGVELGKHLEELPEPQRWKVLADYWVEALLKDAPYGDPEEHMKRLAQGGEFITHLWALLSNAGINHDYVNPNSEW